MNFDEMSILGLSVAHQQELQELFARESVISEVILYGSRAKGTFKPGSDVDLTFKGEGLTTPWLLDFSIKVDDLLMPYEFDLSILSHIENEDLLEHIERVGKVVYRRRGRSE